MFKYVFNALIKFLMSVVVLFFGCFHSAWADGEKHAGYTIVIPDKPQDSEQFAAEELLGHLEKLTGKSYEIVAESKADLQKPYISVGLTQCSKKILEADQLKKLGKEGYVIDRQGKDIFIVGGLPRGTMYGVYDYLESMGIKWLTPQVTVIPKRDAVKLPDQRKRFVPKLWYRDQLWYNLPDKERKWKTRRRLNGFFTNVPQKMGGYWRDHGLCHTFHMQIPYTFFDKHPDWFAMKKDGKRHKGSSHRVELCLTNPELRKYFCKQLIDTIKKLPPGYGQIAVSQDDGSSSGCFCPKCTAERMKHGGKDRWSANMVSFLNYLARGIKKEGLDMRIKTLAYSYTQDAPIDMSLEDNITVVYCGQGDTIYAEGKTNADFYKRNVGQWVEDNASIQLWCYAGSYFGYWWPKPDWFFAGDNVKAAYKAGIKAVFIQGTFTGYSAMTDLKAYIGSRLLWNPDIDTKKVAKEFCELYYGPASDDIYEYLIEFYDYVKLIPADKRNALWGDAGGWRKWTSSKIMQTAESHFAKAFAKVADKPEYLKRVRAAYLPILFAQSGFLLDSENGKGKEELQYLPSGKKRKKLIETVKLFQDIMKENGYHEWNEQEKYSPNIHPRPLGVLLQPHPAYILKNECNTICVVPSLGGRIVSWKSAQAKGEILVCPYPDMDGYPYAGGYEEYSQFDRKSPGLSLNFTMIKSTPKVLEMSAKTKDGLGITRTFSMKGAYLKISTVYKNFSKKNMEIAPRTHPLLSFDLWGQTELYLRIMKGKDKILPMLTKGKTLGGHTYSTDDLVPEFFIVDPKNNYALMNRFDKNTVDKIYVFWGKDCRVITMELWGKKKILKPNEKYVFEHGYQMLPNFQRYHDSFSQ